MSRSTTSGRPFDRSTRLRKKDETAQDLYDAVFGGSMFTLELLVDRVTGVGNAALHVGGFEASRAFSYAAFTSTGGPTITAVGPALAMPTALGRAPRKTCSIARSLGEPAVGRCMQIGLLPALCPVLMRPLCCSRNQAFVGEILQMSGRFGTEGSVVQIHSPRPVFLEKPAKFSLLEHSVPSERSTTQILLSQPAPP